MSSDCETFAGIYKIGQHTLKIFLTFIPQTVIFEVNVCCIILWYYYRNLFLSRYCCYPFYCRAKAL